MGLLDNMLGSSMDDPKTMAVMNMAAGLLGGGNFGQALGRGLGGYTQALQADEDRKMSKLMREMQVQGLKDQHEQKQLAIAQSKANQELSQLMTRGDVPASMQVGPTQSEGAVPYPTRPGGFLGSLNIDQVQAYKQATGQDLLPAWKIAKEGIKKDSGQWYVDAYTGETKYMADPTKGLGVSGGQVTALPGFAAANAGIKGEEAGAVEGAKAGLDPMKVYNSETQQDEFLPRSTVARGGHPMPQQAVSLGGNTSSLTPRMQSFIAQDAAANGITNPVSTFGAAPNGGKWDVSAVQPQQPAQRQPFAAGPSASQVATAKANEVGAEGLAKSSVKMLEESYGSAKGAAASLQTINNIDSILSDKKMMLGTGSDARLALARLGQTIGVGGKDDAEKLANTTALMQQLAQAQLGAAKQMAGQGTITDAERRLLNDTAGGKTSFTAGELKVLSGALRKTAEHTLQSHGTLVGKMRGNPLYAPQIDAFTVDAPAASGGGGAAQGRIVNFMDLK